MHYKKILSLLLLLFSIILVVRLCFHTKENTNDSTNIVSQKQTDTLSDNSIMQNESTHILSENTIFEEEQEVIMIHPDRVSYQDNFYYEPITEEVKERIYGLSYKVDCTIPYEDLRYLSVPYIDFNNETQIGEIICNQAIANDLIEIFYELYQNNYPIEKIKLIDEYDADDDLSCLDNNTSAFNYRTIYGTDRLSKHALGMAIDINPFYNPYVTYPNNTIRISPPGSEAYADRSSDVPYKIDHDDLCYQLFIEHGFTWGGDWNSLKDYQHFEKVLNQS